MENTKTAWRGVRKLALTGAASLALISGPAFAQSSTYDLPATSLSKALREFGQVSGKQIIFTEDLVRGKRSPELKGSFTPEEALQRLLAQSGLRIERTSSGAIMVMRSQVANDQVAPASPGTGDTGDGSTDIVVTGTNIRGANPTGSSLKTYDRSAIAQTGSSTIGDFAAKLPENFTSLTPAAAIYGNPANGISQNGSNYFAGTSFNIHGLGSGATLTLLDGRRLAGAGGAAQFVDISFLPLGAIDRVEILTDGASAIYGSDAISGVANIILRKDIEGAETTVRRGYATDGGGAEWTASQTVGDRWNGGGFIVGYEYHHEEPVLSTERSFVPDQGFAADLTNGSTRNSAFISAHQAVTPTTTIEGNLQFGQQTYSGRNPGFGSEYDRTGRNRIFSGSADIRQRIGTWEVVASGDASEDRQRLLTEAPAFSYTDNSRANSQLVEGKLAANGTLFELDDKG